MNWTQRKRNAKRGEIFRTRRAWSYEAIVIQDVWDERGPPRTLAPASGPTSFPVKRHDPATQALIDAALRERGMGPLQEALSKGAAE